MYFSQWGYSASFTAVAGTVVVVHSYNDTALTALSGNHQATLKLSQSTVTMAPYLGGLGLPDSASRYGCLDISSIQEIDGWTGVEISPAGIIGGLTGTISKGVVGIKNGDNSEEIVTYHGGIQFDARGKASSFGNIPSLSADNLCAGGPLPFTQNIVGSPANIQLGNNSAYATADVWIYVPRSVEPGTYSLVSLGLIQGPTKGTALNSYLPITTAGDQITVLPPPCSISTETNIVFDTLQAAGQYQTVPLEFQCGDIPSDTSLDAYLTVKALGMTASASELTLTNSTGLTGGQVRGYLNGSADCSDNAASIYFDGRYGANIGQVTSGVNKRYDLIWQLCATNAVQPGNYTANAILDIAYK